MQVAVGKEEEMAWMLGSPTHYPSSHLGVELGGQSWRGAMGVSMVSPHREADLHLKRGLLAFAPHVVSQEMPFGRQVPTVEPPLL